MPAALDRARTPHGRARGRGGTAFQSRDRVPLHLMPIVQNDMWWLLLNVLATAVAAAAADYLTPAPRAPVTIYVDSALGSDSAAGTQTSPFATLRRARDAAREAPSPATRVVLSGVFQEMLTLDSGMDSGITWEGRPNAHGAAPILSGATTAVVHADEWRPHAHTNGVWEITLPSAVARRLVAAEKVLHGPDRLPHLFMNGRKVPRVRTATMEWEAPLGITPGLSYNSFW